MERLQKVLAQAGIASRRAAEQIILAGRVRVDGKVVRELGTQVDPRRSRVEVDGTKIVAEKLVYIVLHKPRGVVCTLSDPEGRPTIRELLKEAGARVVPVGRLDFHTSGALLCTNDGEFAQGLAHPKRAVPKVYVAKVKGTVDDDALPKFSESIEIDGRATAPAQVKRLRYEGDKTWLEITLREGRNRQVRRLGDATGFPVMRLARISHAGVTSEDLRPGQWRPLTVDELVDMKKNYGVPKKVRAPHFEPAESKAVKGRQRNARPDVRGEVHQRPRKDERGAKRDEAARAAGERFGAERGESRFGAERGAERAARGESRFVNARGAERGARGAARSAERGARGAEPGARGAERGDRGARGAERGARGAERGARGAERGARGAERGAHGAERGARGAERGARGAERGARGAERGARGAERGARGAERGARGAERGARGAESGAERGARGPGHGEERFSGRGTPKRSDAHRSEQPKRLGSKRSESAEPSLKAKPGARGSAPRRGTSR